MHPSPAPPPRYDPPRPDPSVVCLGFGLDKCYVLLCGAMVFYFAVCDVVKMQLQKKVVSYCIIGHACNLRSVGVVVSRYAGRDV